MWCPTDENPSDLLTKAIASPSKFQKFQSVLLGECEMKKEVVTQEVIAYARARGLTVGVWVTAQLDVERNWRLFAERGVDFLTTNLPAEIFEVFERQPKR